LRSRAIRHIKRRRFIFVRRSGRSCTVAFFARCSATANSSVRGLARRMVLPSFARRRSWGFERCPSQDCSRGGWSRHLWLSRAHVPVCIASSTRLIFVGLDVPLAMRMRAKLSGKSWTAARLASGLRLPSAVRIRSVFFGLPRTEPALDFCPPSGLRTRRCVHRSGLDPARLTSPCSLAEGTIRSGV